MDLINLTPENIDSYINQQEKPMIVDFWATWSTACLMYKEKLELAMDLLGELCFFGTVDIDENGVISERFSIITIPTTLVFYKGAIINQYIGIQEPELLENTIKTLINYKEPPKQDPYKINT